MAKDKPTQQPPIIQRLHDQGFTDLVPIIPPDAPLSEWSSIKDGDRGKIPGRPNQAGTWGGYDWLHSRTQPKALQRYVDAGAGIGVVCRQVIGIDIDIDDAWLSELVVGIAQEQLGWAPARTGRAPRRLLVYRADTQAINAGTRLFIDYGGDTHTLEMRGAGQQFVAYGVHPATGRPYSWDHNLADTGLAELTTIDADQLAAFFDAVEAAVEIAGADSTRRAAGGAAGDRADMDQGELAADDIDDMTQAVAALPNTTALFPTRDDYIRVGCAIKAAFAADPGAGEQVWQDWCARWDEQANAPDVAARDWARMQPPYEIGARWLYEHARAYGGFNDTPQVFADAPVEPRAGAETDGEASANTAASTGTTGVEFWDRYVWVEEQGLFCDLYKRIMLSPLAFSRRLCADIGGATTGKDSPAEIYLLNAAMRRDVDSLTYRPDAPLFVAEDGKDVVNMWRPGPAKVEGWADMPASDADIGPWLDLLCRNFPDDMERGALLDWLAWQVQHEGQKCNWHPVLYGEPGVGKDTMLQPLLQGFGTGNGGNATNQPASVLQSDFTAWLECKSLVVLQEVHSFERRSVADTLKPLLAAPPATLQINRKYMTAYAMPNIVNWVFLTNHADALVLEEKDRRIMVLECAWRQADVPDGYFARLYDWLNDQGGCRQVLAWLGRRALADFNPQATAPMTAAKRAMQGLSLGVVESALTDAIAEGEGVFEQDVVCLSDVKAWLAVAVPGPAGRLSVHRLANMLQRLGARQLPRARVDGVRRRLWRLRDAGTEEGGEAAGRGGKVVELGHRRPGGAVYSTAREVFADVRAPSSPVDELMG